MTHQGVLQVPKEAPQPRMSSVTTARPAASHADCAQWRVSAVHGATRPEAASFYVFLAHSACGAVLRARIWVAP